MKWREIEAIIDAKYQALAERTVSRLRMFHEVVWSIYLQETRGQPSPFHDDNQRILQDVCSEFIWQLDEPELRLLWLRTDGYLHYESEGFPSRIQCQGEVLDELLGELERIASEEVVEEPGPAEDEERDEDLLANERNEEPEDFRFWRSDLYFIERVVSALETLSSRLSTTKAASLSKLIAALRRLPEPTDEIEIRIEISHRVNGDDGASDSRWYFVSMDEGEIAIGAGGSQYDPRVGSDSYTLQSFEWFGDGTRLSQGDEEEWLNGLAYTLTSKHSVEVQDGSCEDDSEEITED